MSLHDVIYSDLQHIFFNPLELGETHTFTIATSTGATKTFSANCTLDSYELERLKYDFSNTGFQTSQILLLIAETAFDRRPYANESIVMDGQGYTIAHVEWELGLLKIGLQVGGSL